MEIKTNLHFHSSDDPEDVIDYTLREGIDAASALGFGALALTCHNKLVRNEEYEKYAASKGVLLISGIEKSIEGRHVVILNPAPEAETLKDFGDLSAYREKHPESFIFAPHPYFLAPYSLGRKLDKHLNLFDAIENSWFYSKSVNLNRRAERLAKAHGIPFLAASDTHELFVLNKSFAVIDAEERTPAAIFKAIRENNFRNVTAPSKFWREMMRIFFWGEMKKILRNKKATVSSG